MITDEIIQMCELYNDAHGYTKEVENLIDFLRTLDEDILSAKVKEKEKFVDKYLELYGR